MVPQEEKDNNYYWDMSSKQQFNHMLEGLNRNHCDLKKRFAYLDALDEEKRKEQERVKKADPLIPYELHEANVLMKCDDSSWTLQNLIVFLFFYAGVHTSHNLLGSGFYFLFISLFFYWAFYGNASFIEKWFLSWREKTRKKSILLKGW